MNSEPIGTLMGSIRAGFSCACPRCGEGRLFRGFLTLRSRCEVCGLDYRFADSGDGPAVFIIFLAGFIVVGAGIACYWLARTAMFIVTAGVVFVRFASSTAPFGSVERAGARPGRVNWRPAADRTIRPSDWSR